MNIAEISQKLKDISQDIEKIFLSLADRFPSLLNRKGGTSLEDLVTVLQNLKQSGDNSAQTEDALFNGFENRYSALYKNLNKKIEELNELDSKVKIIKNDSEEMELITLNAMVISIKSGEKGLAFSCITENLKRLSNQMLQYANHLLTEEAELLRNISDLENIIKAVLESQKKLVFLGNSSNEGLQALIANSSESLNGMSNLTAEVYGPIQKTMEGLQLQDIIRQALDHVLLCLKDYSTVGEAETSFDEKLDAICFDIEVLQISCSVLDDIISQLQEMTNIFNENWTKLTEMLNEVERQKKAFLDRFLAESGDNSESMLLAIEKIQSKFSTIIEEFNNFQSSQKNLEFTCQSITQWANSMNRTFEDLSPVIQNLHHVRVMQGIEVAKNEAISTVRDSVTDMDNYIKSSNNSLDGMQKILEAFSADTREILSEFTKQIENDNKQMKNLKNIKSAFFNQLGKGYTDISEILHNFHALPEGFEQECVQVQSDLRIINSLSTNLIKINDDLQTAITDLQENKKTLLEENGIAEWEIRDNRLKELITHFTITAHKEAAGKIGGFGIEKEGAKSGEITFF